ncbi:MAG: MFS transporter [Candidatus Odinarchaeota archaeon]
MDRTLNFRSIRLVPSSIDRNVAAILLVNLIWTIPWGLIQPFLSPYFFELSNGDYFLTGLLNGIPFGTMIVSVFAFGWIVDKIGSKTVMIAGFITFIVLFITLIFIKDPVLFFLDYVLMNSLLGGFNPAVWKYASLTNKKDIFGSMGAFISLGYFLGAVLSGWIYDAAGMIALFFLSLVVCMIGLFITLISYDLRQSDQELLASNSSNHSTVNLDKSPSPSSITILFSSKILVVLFVISIIHNFQGAFAGLFTSIYFLEELDTPAGLIGIVFGAATLAGTVASHYVGKIGKNRGYKNILIGSYIAYFLVWSAFIVSMDYVFPALFYVIPVYVGLFVAAPAMVADSVPESKRGTLMGVLGASQNLGLAAGAILGGLLAGLQGTFRWNFVVSAALSIILIVFITIFLKEEKRTPTYSNTAPVANFDA